MCSAPQCQLNAAYLIFFSLFLFMICNLEASFWMKVDWNILLNEVDIVYPIWQLTLTEFSYSTEPRWRHHRLRAYLSPASLWSSSPQEPHNTGEPIISNLFRNQNKAYKWFTLHTTLSFQFRPAYHPEGLYDDAKSSIGSNNAGEKPMLQMWHRNGRCPEGTVPIRRTKKDDLLRASSIRRYGRKRHTAPNPLSVDPNMLSEGGHQVRPHGLSYWKWIAWYLHWCVVITELLSLWNAARHSVRRGW